MHRLCLLGLLTLCTPLAADEPAPVPVRTGAVVWTHSGLDRLPAAQAEARRRGRRVLVGLSGSDG